MRTVSVSKFMSLLLRHKPELINLHLDEHGWADIDELAKGVKVPPYIVRMIAERDEKHRFAVDGNRIRANYGHSIPVKIEPTTLCPPVHLYHGTTLKAVVGIIEKGIIPVQRQMVHLADNMELAKETGGRHGPPAVLTVEARRMHYDGFSFNHDGEGPVWAVPTVPVKYIVNLPAYQALAMLSYGVSAKE